LASSVAVVDYGAGNILNVLRAFASQGVTTDLVSDPARLRHYSHVVLPGVGAFDYGMDNLTRLKLGDEIVALVADARPVLGICLGMQLLAERGYENGLTAGLGLISGDIVHLNKLQDADGATRVPHTGWSSVVWLGGQNGPLGLLANAYFNHSFYLENQQDREVVATTAFGEIQIPVAIRAGSLFATQFHPEKSGQAGLALLKSWFDRSGP
jgi:imidazole glycerol-phosphate synthase subunit HisH